MKHFPGSGWTKKLLVYGVVVTFMSASCGVAPSALATTIRGAKTSDEAARSAAPPPESGPVVLALWRPPVALAASSALGDTTETAFPEDEEQKPRHLYRDIGIFVVVSAFVGYFIVKAFIQGDTDQPPSTKKGKQIPG